MIILPIGSPSIDISRNAWAVGVGLSGLVEEEEEEEKVSSFVVVVVVVVLGGFSAFNGCGATNCRRREEEMKSRRRMGLGGEMENGGGRHRGFGDVMVKL